MKEIIRVLGYRTFRLSKLSRTRKKNLSGALLTLSGQEKGFPSLPWGLTTLSKRYQTVRKQGILIEVLNPGCTWQTSMQA